MSDIKTFFENILNKTPHLHLILITDRDGVQLLRIGSLTLNIDIPVTPYIPTDQIEKLGRGTHNSIIISYSNYQIIQVDKNNLVMTFVGSDAFNTGHILSLNKDIDLYLMDIKTAVSET